MKINKLIKNDNYQPQSNLNLDIKPQPQPQPQISISNLNLKSQFLVVWFVIFSHVYRAVLISLRRSHQIHSVTQITQSRTIYPYLSLLHTHTTHTHNTDTQRVRVRQSHHLTHTHTPHLITSSPHTLISPSLSRPSPIAFWESFFYLESQPNEKDRLVWKLLIKLIVFLLLERSRIVNKKEKGENLVIERVESLFP